MPCASLPRGLTDTYFPWSDAIDNNPCGKKKLLTVSGIDVSAQNLCQFHYQMKYGQPLQQPITMEP